MPESHYIIVRLVIVIDREAHHSYDDGREIDRTDGSKSRGAPHLVTIS